LERAAQITIFKRWSQVRVPWGGIGQFYYY
jgi:hypothetical protein